MIKVPTTSIDGLNQKTNNMSYKEHALREFKAAGWDLEKDSMQKMICDHVLEMLDLFAGHGHSGSSAPYAVNMFKKLALFEPLVPLTGEDWEWNEIGSRDGFPHFQNNRCSHVFKGDDFNGQAYDSEGIIFREPNGSCFTSSGSRVPITFPYTPVRKYVDRDAQTDENATPTQTT